MPSSRKSVDAPTNRTPVFTPDGRYLLVRGRLWRTSNPNLSVQARQALVNELMDARRAVAAARRAEDEADLSRARRRVDAAKRGLGERGPVWWTDGAPDLNRHMAANTAYASWANAHEGPDETADDVCPCPGAPPGGLEIT